MKPISKRTERMKRNEYIKYHAEKHGYEIEVITPHLYKVTKNGRVVGYLRDWQRVHATILMDITGEHVAACDDGYSRKTRLV